MAHGSILPYKAGMAQDRFNNVVLIAGPTASGKSSLALNLAARTPTRIINADSMQVYGDLRVLSARPSADEEAMAEHRLYGVLDGAERCSVARWLDLALAEIAEARAAGLLPVVVGGTGLYFKALLEGLAPVPEVPDELFREGQALIEREGAPALHGRLAAIDAEMANRLNATDPQRVLRAWAVMRATGRSLADWQNDPVEPPLGDTEFLKAVLVPDRDWLYARCDARFDMMMQGGAVEEVKTLLARGLAPDLPVMKAVGVPQLADMLAGHISPEQAVEDAKRESRRYAKRQLTWGRNQMISWDAFDAQQMESVCDKMLAKIC